MVRGVERENASPFDLAGYAIEKPWIGVVETLAIGGGYQLLLVMDCGACSVKRLPVATSASNRSRRD